MVLGHLDNAKRYLNLHPAFAKAFEFLKRADLASLPLGRHEVDGDRIYATISKGVGRGRQAAKLEAHRKYIDIQFVLRGADLIGWRTLKHCSDNEQGYDEQKDVELFTDSPDVWLALHPGHFVVFFPEDAHAPLSGEGEHHKVVVKVKL